MKRFKVGDIVIALNNPTANGQPRVKGNEYSVLDIKYCAKCGEQSINITNYLLNNMNHCNCGNSHITNKEWTYSKHFILKEDLQKEIELAVLEERYEDAALFTKLK